VKEICCITDGTDIHKLFNMSCNRMLYRIQLRYFRICIPFPRSLCSFNADTNFMQAFIHTSMALQPFVGPCPLLQFRNPFYTDGRILGRGISPSQGRYLHTEQHKHRINVKIHPWLWVGPETTIPAFERVKIVYASDQAATVLGLVQTYAQKFHNRRSIFRSVSTNIRYSIFLAFKRSHVTNSI
jgi:hypothetical protein